MRQLRVKQNVIGVVGALKRVGAVRKRARAGNSSNALAGRK